MLTIHGNTHTLCDGIPRRSFLKIGAFAFGAAQFTLADVLRRTVDWEVVAQGGHQHLSRRRSAAPGYVGHQDRCPQRDSRRVQADRDKGARHANRRMLPEDRRGSGQVRVHPLGGRGSRRARRHPVHDRPRPVCLSHYGRLAEHGLGRRARLYGPVDPSVPPFVGLAARTQHMPWSDSGQARLPRNAVCRVQARRQRHVRHEAKRRQQGSAGRSQNTADELSTASAAMSKAARPCAARMRRHRRHSTC